jgi:hypothetical protein
MRHKHRSVQIPAAVVQSESFHGLSGAALKLLIAIASRHDGDNGRIAFGVADTQEALGVKRPCSTRKACNAIRELIASGLAARTQRRHSTRSPWRLAWLPAITATGAHIPASFGLSREAWIAAVRAEYERLLNDADCGVEQQT